jgi:hypothetical protein
VLLFLNIIENEYSIMPQKSMAWGQAYQDHSPNAKAAQGETLDGKSCF